jgi:hypothetical protein
MSVEEDLLYHLTVLVYISKVFFMNKLKCSVLCLFLISSSECCFIISWSQCFCFCLFLLEFSLGSWPLGCLTRSFHAIGSCGGCCLTAAEISSSHVVHLALCPTWLESLSRAIGTNLHSSSYLRSHCALTCLLYFS